MQLLEWGTIHSFIHHSANKSETIIYDVKSTVAKLWIRLKVQQEGEDKILSRLNNESQSSSNSYNYTTCEDFSCLQPHIFSVCFFKLLI